MNLRLTLLKAALLFVYGRSMCNFCVPTLVAIDLLHMLEIERIKADDAFSPLFNHLSFLPGIFLFLFILKDLWEIGDDFTPGLCLQNSFLYEVICKLYVL